mgnify:CR=1 FL=1
MFILKRNLTGHFSCQRLRKAGQSNDFFRHINKYAVDFFGQPLLQG